MPAPTHTTRINTLHIQHLRYAFAGAPAPLLDIRQWAWPAGVHLLHGDSGTGKTTLLRMLAQQLPAQDGAVQELTLAAEPAHPRQADPAFWQDAVFYDDIHADHWAQHTGHAYLAQHLPLKPGQDSKHADDAPHLTSPALQRAYSELLAAFKLAPHLEKQLFMLSTGTRHKLMLLAALLSPKPMVLLDEPLAGLDFPSINALWYALAVRQRIPGQRVLLATATPPQDLPPLRWTGVWQLPT